MPAIVTALGKLVVQALEGVAPGARMRLVVLVGGWTSLVACTNTSSIERPAAWQSLTIIGDSVQVEISEGGKGAVVHYPAQADCVESYQVYARYLTDSGDPGDLQLVEVGVYVSAAGVSLVPEVGGSVDTPVYVSYWDAGRFSVHGGSAAIEFPAPSSFRLTLADTAVCPTAVTCGAPETVVVEGELSDPLPEENEGRAGPRDGWVDPDGAGLCGMYERTSDFDE